MKNLGMILLMASILMIALIGFTLTMKFKKACPTNSMENEADGAFVSGRPIAGKGLFVAGIFVVVLGEKS